MRLLLDTHAFLWWVGDDPALTRRARAAIARRSASTSGGSSGLAAPIPAFDYTRQLVGLRVVLAY